MHSLVCLSKCDFLFCAAVPVEKKRVGVVKNISLLGWRADTDIGARASARRATSAGNFENFYRGDSYPKTSDLKEESGVESADVEDAERIFDLLLLSRRKSISYASVHDKYPRRKRRRVV